MQRRAKKLLYDVQQAAEAITSFVQGRTYEDYLGDLMLRSAVERKFEIIGEALNRLSKDAPEVAVQIEDYRKIIAFRNVLIHGYDTLENESVRGSATKQLPFLIVVVERLLAS